jgi:hypothetical protein
MNAEAKDLDEQIQKPPKTTSRPKPCDDCSKAKRCRDESLGCAALVVFYHSNLNGSPVRWAYAPRFPSRELYERAHAPVKVTPARAVYRRPRVFEDSDDSAEID